MGEKRKANAVWADHRKGFKHELIESLVGPDITYREAKKIVEATFDAVKDALLRKESVEVDGFGNWSVVAPKNRRGFRLGKIVNMRSRIVFQVDEKALASARETAKRFHPGWENSPTRRKKLRGKKLQELLRAQESQRRTKIRDQYLATIVTFFRNSLNLEDWEMIWTIRWSTPWFASEAAESSRLTDKKSSIEEAEALILATKPIELHEVTRNEELTPRDQSINRCIDIVRWYARWTTHLQVDPTLWENAERWASYVLRTGIWPK